MQSTKRIKRHTVVNNTESITKNPVENRLLEIAVAAKLWHTPTKDAYASIPGIGNWPVDSKTLRDWLTWRYYSENRRPPVAKQLENAVQILEARAKFEGAEYQVHVRVGEHEGKVYLDLADDRWQAVEITRDGWEIISNPPIKFIRPGGMGNLPKPVRGGSIDDLKAFLNVGSQDDFVALLGCIIGSVHPSGPYPILVLNGEQGSAKSTTSRLIRRLIDPHEGELRSLHGGTRDLAAAARNNWILAYDNLSIIRPGIADDICRLATGAGFAGRELYTNTDEVSFTAARPIILNGIPPLAKRADLADRAITITLPAISPGKRETEGEFWARFEAAHPKLLGVLCDAVSCALKRLDEVRIDRMPRMADFAKWITAAEPALDLADGTFLNAYEANRAQVSEQVVENDLVADALFKLLDSQSKFEGSATDLHVDLKSRIPFSLGQANGWPRNPSALSAHLKRLAPVLRSFGVQIVWDRQGKVGRRVIRITKEDSSET